MSYKTQVFWHQSEARTAATVWNWSGKTLSPGALLAVLYFSFATFSRPFRLSVAPTICPWVSEDRVASECVGDVFTTFWWILWSVTYQNHLNKESLPFSKVYARFGIFQVTNRRYFPSPLPIFFFILLAYSFFGKFDSVQSRIINDKTASLS